MNQIILVMILVGMGASSFGPSLSRVPGGCSCAIDGGLVEVTNCRGAFPLASNISVDFSKGVSGVCEPGGGGCDLISHCSGAVKITAQTNAFTGFVPFPNVGGVPAAGTVTRTVQANGCGAYNADLYSIVNNFGVSICLVDFATWCDYCL